MRLSRVLFRDPMQDPDGKDGPDQRPDVFTDEQHELTLADSVVTIRSRETGKRVLAPFSGTRYVRVLDLVDELPEDGTVVLESFPGDDVTPLSAAEGADVAAVLESRVAELDNAATRLVETRDYAAAPKKGKAAK